MLYLIFFIFCSQKQRKAALRKERRKRKRQALAQARDTGTRQSLIVVVKCDCTVQLTNEHILLQVLITKTITFLRRMKIMRITTLPSWKGDAKSNQKSSQAAHFPTLTYPQKNNLVRDHVGELVSQRPLFLQGRFLKLKITVHVNQY